jgi:hypothetical protein
MSKQAAYAQAQKAIADLKGSIYLLLSEPGFLEVTNAEIGRALGIYHGHVGHEGHIPRALLTLMEQEGVLVQNEQTKKWKLK